MRPSGPDSPPPSDHDTGVPGFRSWRSMYVFVLGWFVVLVVALALFSRAFR